MLAGRGEEPVAFIKLGVIAAAAVLARSCVLSFRHILGRITAFLGQLEIDLVTCSCSCLLIL